jgi:hypothetical protein
MTWEVELYESGALAPQFTDGFASFDMLMICVDQLGDSRCGDDYILRFTIPDNATLGQIERLQWLGLVNGEPIELE